MREATELNKERWRDGERQKDRKTERQKDRKTERQTQRDNIADKLMIVSVSQSCDCCKKVIKRQK